MKKIEKAVCWICKDEYNEAVDANKCEKNGLIVPYFKIGDTATYQAYLGSDRDGSNYDGRTGTVIDILFPIPPNYYNVGHALLHKYQVSYLINRRASESSTQFFAEKSIKLLQIIKTIEVVDEASMFFADGTYINEQLNINTHRSKRTVVTNWDAYVMNIVRRNPQLQERLKNFTARLRKLDCLD